MVHLVHISYSKDTKQDDINLLRWSYLTSVALPVTPLKAQAMKKVKSSKSYTESSLHFRLELKFPNVIAVMSKCRCEHVCIQDTRDAFFL